MGKFFKLGQKYTNKIFYVKLATLRESFVKLDFAAGQGYFLLMYYFCLHLDLFIIIYSQCFCMFMYSCKWADVPVCVCNVCLTGLVTWPNPNEDPDQQVVRRSSPGTLRLWGWWWWSRTSVNWTNTLCVSPLFSVSHVHFLFVHLPPTLCDKVSVSAHRAFLVHKVGWHVSKYSGVSVKIN